MTTVDLDAIRARLGAAVAAWSEATGDPNDALPQQASAADVPVLLELVEGLRQELDEVRAERDAARFERDQERHVRKVNEYGLLGKLGEAEAERDRARPVVEAADALMDFVGGLTAPLPPGTMARLGTLAFALDAARSATPDAEPAPGGEPEWRQISADEYLALDDANQPLSVGETLSDPGGRFGTPHMLTTWESADGRPVLRHQCWPKGSTTGFDRPCLYETTLPAPGVPVDTEASRDA